MGSARAKKPLQSPGQSSLQSPGGQNPVDALRLAARERWLTVLFAPEAARQRIAAIHMLDQAFADIRAAVHLTPMMGLVRLRWWRDALEAHAEARPEAKGLKNPALDAVGPLLAAGGVPMAGLEALIDAHEMLFSEDDAARAGHADAHGAALAALLLGALEITGDRTGRLGARVCAGWRRRTLGLAPQPEDPSPAHWPPDACPRLPRAGLCVWLLRYLPADAPQGWRGPALLPLRLWLAALRG